MGLLLTWWRRLIGTLYLSRNEARLSEDCATHLDGLQAAHRARGLSEREAEFAARRDFGPIELMKESFRDQASFTALGNIGRDLRYAVRSLRQTPAFTAVAVASLAFGIGANAAIFCFVDAILLRQLAVLDPNGLALLKQDGATMAVKIGTVDALAAAVALPFDGVLGTFPIRASLSAADRPAEMSSGELVTGQYFRTLRVVPIAGRLMTQRDINAAVGDPVCNISYTLWRDRFALDPAILSRTLTVNAHRYRILGVTGPGFRGASLHAHSDVFLPVTRVADVMPGFSAGTGIDWRTSLSWLNPMIRLKPRVSRTEAAVALNSFWKQFAPSTSRREASIVLAPGDKGLDTAEASYGKPVIVLLGISGTLLLAACINLANLLLARGQARSREFAVRLAVGGSRFRIVQQLLLEGVLLCALGTLAGLGVAFALTRTVSLMLLRPQTLGPEIEPTVGGTVLVFTCLVASFTVLLFALLPALQSTRQDLVPALKDGSGGTQPATRLLLRKGMVVLQFSLSLVLLFCAGLFTRTLRNLQAVDLGYAVTNVITLRVDAAAAGYSEQRTAVFDKDLLAQISVLPGVRRASLAVWPPLAGAGISLTIAVPGFVPKSQEEVTPNFNFVAPGYFDVIHQHLLRGRDFSEHDVDGAPRVAVVNEHFARHFFAGRNPVGRNINQGGGVLEIIGVVRDARDFAIREQAADMVYASVYQGQSSGVTLLADVDRDPRPMLTAMREVVHARDSNVPITQLQTLAVSVEDQLSTTRLLSDLSLLFSGSALLLAGLGMYGVMAYGVLRRTREIGVRSALGATRGAVTWLFLRESLGVLCCGILLGVPCASAAVQVVRRLLYGAPTFDVMSLFASTALLVFAALAATLLPLLRASRIDPLRSLRHD